MRRVLACAVFCWATGPGALANGVRIVDASGSGAYWPIQAAVDAAADGDVLLVGAGSYAGFSVSGKGLAILAQPGAQVVVTSGIEISGVPAGSILVLSGLEVRGLTYQHAIRASNCAGTLRIQDCISTGGSNLYTGGGMGAGLELLDCASVSVTHCQLFGGDNHDNVPGGVGLHALSSSVAVHDSLLRGGEGIGNCDGASNGGHGCHAQDSSLYAAGSTFRGGDYLGDTETGETPRGGHGLALDRPASALACSFLGGHDGGLCGSGINGLPVSGCCLYVLPGTARSFECVGASGDARWVPVTVRGEPGDRAFLLASATPDLVPERGLSGVWLIDPPELLHAQPLGVIPATGVLDAEFRLPFLPDGTVRQGVFLQGLAVPAAGAAVLGNPSYLVALNGRSDPDCDADEVQDFVAILDGLAPDTNHDITPDPCQWTGPTWFVDANVPGPGTGAPEDPFRTLASAFGAALSGHTIVVADGVYSGPSNRNLDFGGRDLIVWGANGPGACVVDCERQGRAFLMIGGPLALAELRGFTIRNGDAFNPWPETTAGSGGGIYVSQGAQLSIRHCVIMDCQANLGGGLYLEANVVARIEDTIFSGNGALSSGGGAWIHGTSSVRRCSFLSNEVTTAGHNATGGGGIFVSGSGTVIDQCLFQGNRSVGRGGGVCLSSSSSSSSSASTVLSHSRILENEAALGGGVKLGSTTSIQTADIHDCLIAGNTATIGGGGILREHDASTRITSCTVTGNRSETTGGGYRHEGTVGDDSTLISDSVFWRNFDLEGVQIYSNATPPTQVRYSDVSLGPDGIQGNVTLGPGILGADPLLLDPNGPDGDPATTFDNDYRLSAGSPCIDAGSNHDLSADVGDVDGDGITSEQNPLDLAWQRRLVDDPAVPDSGSGTPPVVDIGAYERPR